MTHEQVIKAMGDKLRSIDPSAKAYLFGSRARGDARDDSDWDVLILLDKPRVTLEDYNKYSYPLWELGWNFDELINTVIFTEKEWRENTFTLFNHNVRAEAIAI